jgi:SPP1 gp7 family putative phage head morphogenesis protein
LLNKVWTTVRDYAESKLQKPTEGEISASSSKLYAKYKMFPYNPDDLARRKGGLKVYDEMLKDDQIKALLAIKKKAVTAPGWDIVPASEDAADIEQAEFVKWVLLNMRGTLKRDIEEILTALDYGFSISEEIWEYIQRGPYKGRVGLKAIKTREPHDFDFEQDEHDNITELIQTLGGERRTYPMEKFIHLSYEGRFGNPYGTSDLRAAYRSWWSKNVIVKFWNIFLERFGMPTAVGKYRRGTQQVDIDALEKILEDMQSKMSVTIPEDMKIDLLEAVRQGQAGYDLAIEKHNTMMARSLLVPDKLGYTESKSGSYNLGEKHFDFFMVMVDDLGKEVEESVINEQVIRRLIDYNYPDVEEYPRFEFKPRTEENKKELAEQFEKATNIGAIDTNEKEDFNFVRRRLGMPEVDDAEWEERQSRKKERQQEAMEKTDPEEDDDPELDDPKKKEPKKFTLSREPTEYEKKVNFTEIANSLETHETKGKKRLGDVAVKMRDDLKRRIDKLVKKGIKAKDVSSISLKYINEFKRGLQDLLIEIYQDGKKDAASEVKKEYTKKYIDLTAAAREFFVAKALTIAGIEEDYILKGVQMILYNHIKNGKTMRETMYEIDQFFKQYISTGEIKDGELLSAHRLEVIIRTNVSEAYNEGRKAMFRDPEVADFVKAYQYSAIMDSRTTDFCRSYDGNVYEANDPIWDRITPPNHFQCRSTIVAILETEPYELSDKVNLDPAKGFYSCGHSNTQNSAIWEAYLSDYEQRFTQTLNDIREGVINIEVY